MVAPTPRALVLDAGESRSRELAKAIGAQLVTGVPEGGAALAYGPHGLELRLPEDAPGHGVGVEVDWLLAALSRGAQHLRGDPLVRAIGPAQRVVDATAGLGGDSLLLAAVGMQVIAFERVPAVHALLADGLSRAAIDPLLAEIVARIDLRLGDAIDALDALSADEAIDVVLIDPMFPPKRRRSALPPKSMQAIRRVVGDDPDASALLVVARRVARRRVVLKRPDDAAQLSPDVHASIESKTVRCDLYLPSGARSVPA